MENLLLRELEIIILPPIRQLNITKNQKTIKVKILNTVKHTNKKDKINLGLLYSPNTSLVLKGHFEINESLIDNIINALWNEWGIKVIKEVYM